MNHKEILETVKWAFQAIENDEELLDSIVGLNAKLCNKLILKGFTQDQAVQLICNAKLFNT